MNLTTKLYKIDYDFILTHCTNKKLWNKKWTIFEYDNIKIKMELYSINIDYNTITLKAELDDNKDSVIICINLPLNIEHRNIKVLEKKVNGEIIRDLISYYEKTIIRKSSLYKQARNHDNEYRKRLKIIAVNFLDSEKVTNESIRDAYITSYVYDNEISTTQSAIDALRYTLSAKLYLSFLHTTGYSKELIETILAKNISGETSNFYKKLKKKEEYLNSEEFEEDLKAELGNV